MKFKLIALLVPLLSPGIAFSDEIGTVTASFDGAEPRSYYALEDNGESQSFWTQTIPGMLNGSSFSIWANPTETANTTNDVIVLGATLMRGSQGYIAIADFQYLETYFSSYWTNPDDDAVSITLTTVAQDGDRLIVEGTFSAPVFHTQNAANPQTDRSRAMTITGRFSAALPKE